MRHGAARLASGSDALTSASSGVRELRAASASLAAAATAAMAAAWVPLTQMAALKYS